MLQYLKCEHYIPYVINTTIKKIGFDGVMPSIYWILIGCVLSLTLGIYRIDLVFII